MYKDLNEDQKTFMNFHRNSCKQSLMALKCNKPMATISHNIIFDLLIGMGKSPIITKVKSGTIKYFKASRIFDPEEVIVLLTAPTGVVAFNIDGVTLHAAFQLGCNNSQSLKPLTFNNVNTFRTKLSKLVLLVIDEISMVGCNMLYQIHQRLQQIKGINNSFFGNVSVLVIGDLYQLPPVRQRLIYEMIPNPYAALFNFGCLWKDLFKLFELTIVMRQQDDAKFIAMLNRIIIGQLNKENINML